MNKLKTTPAGASIDLIELCRTMCSQSSDPQDRCGGDVEWHELFDDLEVVTKTNQ